MKLGTIVFLVILIVVIAVIVSALATESGKEKIEVLLGRKKQNSSKKVRFSVKASPKEKTQRLTSVRESKKALLANKQVKNTRKNVKKIQTPAKVQSKVEPESSKVMLVNAASLEELLDAGDNFVQNSGFEVGLVESMISDYKKRHIDMPVQSRIRHRQYRKATQEKSEHGFRTSFIADHINSMGDRDPDYMLANVQKHIIANAEAKYGRRTVRNTGFTISKE